MPIRIKKDKNADRGNTSPNRPTNGGNGAGGLIAFAPLLLSLFKKNPKIAILLAVIGGAYYFYTNNIVT